MTEDDTREKQPESDAMGCFNVIMVIGEVLLGLAAIACFVFAGTLAQLSPEAPQLSANAGVKLLVLAAAGELLRRVFGWAFRQ